MKTKHLYVIAFVLVVAIAIFFRFWQITSIPTGLYPDEAMNGVDALDSLKSGNFSVFYPNNNGREGMIIWLDALAIKAFGITPWALRVFPALAGVLAVLGLYFLLKELFEIRIALAGSFFMATGFWAVLFSRIGFRASLMIPFILFAFYFLLKGFRTTRFLHFIIAGILFGFGFYTYLAFRFAPILALIVFLPLLIKSKSNKLLIGAAIFAVFSTMVALPLGIYFFNHSVDFFGRAGQVSIFNESSPVKALAVNLVKTLGMFNFAGDFNWRHNFSGSPQLFWPVGILFLYGVYLGARRRQFAERFLFSWFLIFLFPAIFSSEGLPHALRSLALAPIAYAFAGLGLVDAYQKIQDYFNKKLADKNFEAYFVQLRRLKKEVLVLFLIFLFLVAIFESSKYFVSWAINPETRDAFSENYVKEAEYLKKLPADINKYVIVNAPGAIARGVPMPAMTAMFLLWGKDEVKYITPDFANFENVKRGRNGAVIVPLQFNFDLFDVLRKQFKDVKIEIIDINAGAIIIP